MNRILVTWSDNQVLEWIGVLEYCVTKSYMHTEERWKELGIRAAIQYGKTKLEINAGHQNYEKIEITVITI